MSARTLDLARKKRSVNTAAHIPKCRSQPGVAVAVALCTAVAITPVFADDTEIFFGQADPGLNTSPNVLFVLDTSGSMNGRDNGYSGTRLERMKDALTYILDSSANINVGLMRFNGFYSGGSVIYPMTPIDETVCANSNCGTLTLSSRVDEDNGDMEQFVSSGIMTPEGTRLSLGAENGDAQLVGVRFQDITVPAGATITSAHIEFTAERSDAQDAALQIVGHDTADSPSIASTNKYLSDLPKTAARVNWSPEGWSKGDVYESPDLRTIVQEITDRSDWCGGQSLGFVVSGTGERAAHAYNGGNASRSAVLRVSYDSGSIPANRGCTRQTAVSQVKESIDDAYEYSGGNNYSTGWNVRLPQAWTHPAYRTRNRLRFQDLNIPRGAIIENARIVFNVNAQLSGAVSIEIDAESHNNAPALIANRSWIASQPLLSGGVQWGISQNDTWATGTDVHSPDVSSLVQRIVNQTGWESSNDIAFQFSRGANHTSENFRSFSSFDSNRARAPKLLVEYRLNAGATNTADAVFKTARDDMKQVVNELSATGGTPIVSAYVEASNYLLGGPVNYGKERGFTNNKHRYHRVSHPESYRGGTVTRDIGCTDENLESDNCRNEKIVGNASYISPLAHSCQTSHVVFLSDGAATSNTAADQVKALTGVSNCKVGSGNEACGVELAQWLNDTDHNLLTSRKQNISTYTIGFNNKSTFLQSIATAGGGDYRDANSSAELVSVFQDILGDVLAVDTSFVGPGATVNQFNRLTHRNDIYYAVFKPDAKPTWAGNIKRYQAEVNNDGDVEIRDQNGVNVVDEDTGFFSSSAKSFWSDVTDGNSVEKGGAAAKLSLKGPDGQGNRRVYTVIGDIPIGGVALKDDDDYELHEDNNKITESILAITGSNSDARKQKRENLLKWARGVDITDSDIDNETNDPRQFMGDPMHSQPVILNYANGAGTDTTIFMATNEGMLHAVEHVNGTELFAFMPEELLENVDKFYENQQSTRHPYGLDGDLTVWHDDKNGNVMVDGNEKAYLFVGMRRGGNLYYGFDISQRTDPKLLWKIEGGKGDFENLAQTWSKPVATKIMRNSQERTVLIFGGGYDDANNDPNSANLVASQTPDSKGRAVYVVNAGDGKLLWSGQGDTSGNKQFNDMNYSIPANIRVLDVNADGLADQMYVGDMGGQLWRFDFTPYHSSGALVDGGVIAKLKGSGIDNARRFYNEPDVALISNKGQRFLSVGIGSGWRAHPLNDRVSDRFYMIKQDSIFGKPAGYGKNIGTAITPVYTPMTEADLVNITDDLSPPVNQHGWMLKMEGEGEKVLGASLTVNNQLILTTYQPTDAADPCSPAIGGGYAYVVNVLNGAPTVDLQSDGNSEDADAGSAGAASGDSIVYQGKLLDKSDRRRKLKHGGIPPAPSLLIVETKRTYSRPAAANPDDDSAQEDSTPSGTSASGDTAQSVTTSTIGISLRVNLEDIAVDVSNLTQRTYWHDRGRGDRTPIQISPNAGDD